MDGSYKENQTNHDSSRKNCFEEAQIEIFGFKEKKGKVLLTWIGYFFSLGLLRLLHHWYPRVKLYSTHSSCSLEDAEKVLIADVYKEKYKTYSVKEVKNLSTNLRTKENSGASLPMYKRLSKEEKLKINSCRLSFNIGSGSPKELLEARAFWYKKLCYIWDDEKKKFIKLAGLDEGIRNCDLYSYEGFDSIEQFTRRITYGFNKINVPLQTILTLLVLEAVNPFYVFQVFSLIIWCAEHYYYYTIAIVAMSAYGITSSIIQTRKNQKNLQGTVSTDEKVNVCRGNDVYEEILSTYLVPGDVIVIPPNGCTMMCDAVLKNGYCIVNESMLTGESVPVTKTPIPTTNKLFNIKQDANHTLFSGTKVIQAKNHHDQKVCAVVIRTGYMTTKGELIRSILYPPPVDFKFDRDSYKFIGILSLIALCGFIYTIVIKSIRDIAALDVFIKALDLITIAIPPALPAAMTVGKLYALDRLKKKGIFCMNSRVINVSGSINCVCFDKTGTLTEDSLDMWGVVPCAGGHLKEPIKDPSTLPLDSLFLQGMVTCHSLTLVDGETIGDPLDLKMFQSTRWSIKETQTFKDDFSAPTVVTSPVAKNPKVPEENQFLKEIGVVNLFQFSSSLQRMSVITKNPSSSYLRLFCKGSPEMIVSLSKQETVPEDVFEKLEEYTKKGYRVLALSTKVIEVDEGSAGALTREEAECDLSFLGLIVLENRLKPESSGVVEILKDADVKVVMVTGDNKQTALSVARECGIVALNTSVVNVTVDSNPRVVNYSFDESPDVCREQAEDEDYCFVMSGGVWQEVKKNHRELVPKILQKGAVFARMSSQQKRELVLELQTKFYVAMCGDGANDCGALKTAHVGISLSETEASVASSFTSKRQNISCVPEVIKEGRAALVTSFGIFKFMICYSLAEFTSAIILYGIDGNLNAAQYLFIDVCLVLNFASFFGMTKAWDERIVKASPNSSLLSSIPLFSLTLNVSLIVSFQVLGYKLIQSYRWFRPFAYDPKDFMNFRSYENYSVFTVSLFQYIIMAVVFSKGKPYRQPMYTNIFFSSSIIICTVLCLYITLDPCEWFVKILELQMPPTSNARIIIVTLAGVNLFLALVAEDFFIEYLIPKKLGPFVDRLIRSKKKQMNCMYDKRDKNEKINGHDSDLRHVVTKL